MEKKIEYISFLFEDQRIVIKASSDGTFRVPFESSTGSKYGLKPNVYYKNLTARQVVEDSRIKNADPVLTLTNGEKLRVFQGGDSSYLPALSEGVLERHDSYKKKLDATRQAEKSSRSNSTSTGLGAFDIDWGYDDGWN